MAEYATVIRLSHAALIAALLLGFGCGADATSEGPEAVGEFGENPNTGLPEVTAPEATEVGDGSVEGGDPRFQLPDADTPVSTDDTASTEPLQDGVGPTPGDVTSTAGPEDGSEEDVEGPPPSQGDVFVEPTDPSLAIQPLAGVCSEGDDCETADCNTDYPGGYCTVWCGSVADCPGDAKCYNDPQSGKKMCWKACDSPDDCRVDQFCAGGVCTPKCWETSCQLGYECDSESGQCVPVGSQPCIPEDEVCDGVDNNCDGVKDEGCGPTLSQHPYVVVDDLGLVSVGGGGVSKTLKAHVDDDTTTLSLLIIDADGSNEVMAFWKIYGPDDTLLLDALDPIGSPVRGYPEYDSLTVQIPNTPDVPLQTGTYEFSIYREGDTLGAVWVYVVRTVRPQVQTSYLDVNFWFVGTPDLSAQSAQSSSKFNKLRNTFVNLMASYSVTVSQVNFFDVIGIAANKYTYVDVSDDGYEVDEHAELVALSESLPSSNRGINFFFVQGFNGYSLLGKAGGIPGPPLLHGSYHSGVVVSMTDYYWYGANKAAAKVSETMAHELGHQLGLYHTTESDGSYHDPLSDTPQCTDDWNEDGYVDAWECEDAGGDNLMFWSAGLSSTLTDDQRYVIHHNAMMY
jgi:hypothetical protein